MPQSSTAVLRIIRAAARCGPWSSRLGKKTRRLGRPAGRGRSPLEVLDEGQVRAASFGGPRKVIKWQWPGALAEFRSSSPRHLRRLRVKTDKTHCEHNESGYPSIADIRADIDWRRLVPTTDIAHRAVRYLCAPSGSRWPTCLRRLRCVERTRSRIALPRSDPGRSGGPVTGRRRDLR